jgi:hypothetical protein
VVGGGAGNYSWDPLHLYPDPIYPQYQRWIQECELNHGRLAMLAFTGMYLAEWFTGIPASRAPLLWIQQQQAL